MKRSHNFWPPISRTHSRGIKIKLNAWGDLSGEKMPLIAVADFLKLYLVYINILA